MDNSKTSRDSITQLLREIVCAATEIEKRIDARLVGDRRLHYE